MAKGQKHGNREIKKPKQVKVAAPAATEGFLARAKPPGSTIKKGA